MKTTLLIGASCLFLATVSAERWSRQLSNNLNSQQVLNDWVPVGANQQQYQQQPPQTTPQQIEQTERSANARVLSYPQNVFPSNQQNNLQQQRNQQQQQQQQQQFNFVHPFQFQQFKTQQNQQPPTSQSFFKFEMPSFGLDGNRNNAPPVQTGYQIQHTFGPSPSVQQLNVGTAPLFSQKPVFPSEYHPVTQSQPLLHRKPVQDNYIAEQITQQRLKDSKTTQAQDNLVAQRPDLFTGQQHSFQLQKPTSFQSQFPSFRAQQNIQSPPPLLPQDEEVQLLYVPYDTLYSQRNQHHQSDFNNGKYNLVQEPVNPIQINNFYTQDPLDNPQPNLYSTTTTSTTLKPALSTYKPDSNLQQFLHPRFTTLKPSQKPKPKPHQPPLAMFYQKVSARSSPKDVINALSSTKSIAVLDAPSKTAPEVFVGPAGLPTPSGYTKYELPYLSSFDHNNLETNLKEAPFFVAPLSYKTPSGFEKILLPEPHVGSIVINKPNQVDEYVQHVTTGRPHSRPTQDMYITPFGGENGNRFVSTTARYPTSTRNQPTPTGHRWQTEQSRGTSPPKDFYRNQYQNEAILEVSSPRTHKKPHHHHQKRPEQAFTQTVKPYAQFKPMPNNIGNDEFFKVKQSIATTLATTPATSLISTTSSSPSTSQRYFSETSTPRGQFFEVSSQRPSSRPEVTRGHFYDVSSSPRPEIQTTRGAFYEISSQRPSPRPESNRFNEVSSTASSIPVEPTREHQYEVTNRRPTSGRPDVVQHRYHSKPLFDDEYRMKQYFREQEVFKSRPPIQSTTQTNRPETMIEYTPVSLDYANPSSTANYYEGSTLRTTTPKFTFYHPTAQSYDENVQTITLAETEETNASSTPDIQTTSERLRPTHATRLPANHRPTYDNEVTVYNHDEKPSLEELQFDPNPYGLPSELPPLTPNLPGLVNALRENERLNAIEKETTESLPTTTSTTLRPTRRTIANRGRRPTSRTSTSSSVSYSSSDDITTRRPLNRARRPFNPRNNSTNQSVAENGNISSSTTRSTSVRNPNRVRYNSTIEERKQFRTRNRNQNLTPKKYKQQKPQEDNIEYQRDVLKQNYPVFKHPTRKPYFSTTDKNDDVVTVTPNTLKDTFPGLLEPMQIAQQYQQQSQDNYGPGYFPNEEDINPTEPINNEIYQTTPSTLAITTTELPPTTTKRSSLFRRQRPTRITTEPSVTTESSSSERYTVRPRTRNDGTLPRRVIKVRTRPRRPHPASTTTEPERTGKENSYQKVSKFNQDFYNDDYKSETNNKRAQLKSKFNLEPQESQWSPSLTRSDSFKPINPRDGMKSVKFDNEPDIVTAEPEDDRKTKDTYEFNVSAGFGPKINTYGSIVKSDTGKASESRPDRKVEPTFEELLEQVMSDIGRESKKLDKTEAATTTTTSTTTTTTEIPSIKSKIHERNHKLNFNRRGSWKKVRVQPTDSFETAESQNIGTQLRNHIYSNEKLTDTKLTDPKENESEGLTTSFENLISSTTEKLSTDEPSEMTTTIIPEMLLPETTVSPTFKTKVETVTSISQETSRSRQKLPTLLPNENVVMTSSPGPTQEIDSTTTRFYNQDYEEDESIGETITRRIDENQSNDNDDQQVSDDLETQSSLFDEVRSQLKVLFAAESDDDQQLDLIKPNFQPHKHEYTSIHRIRSITEEPQPQLQSKSVVVEPTAALSSSSSTTTTTKDIDATSKDTTFHKNLMKNVVFATATSTEIAQDTEICYRGRCIKSNKQ